MSGLTNDINVLVCSCEQMFGMFPFRGESNARLVLEHQRARRYQHAEMDADSSSIRRIPPYSGTSYNLVLSLLHPDAARRPKLDALLKDPWICTPDPSPADLQRLLTAAPCVAPPRTLRVPRTPVLLPPTAAPPPKHTAFFAQHPPPMPPRPAAATQAQTRPTAASPPKPTAFFAQHPPPMPPRPAAATQAQTRPTAASPPKPTAFFAQHPPPMPPRPAAATQGQTTPTATPKKWTVTTAPFAWFDTNQSASVETTLVESQQTTLATTKSTMNVAAGVEMKPAMSLGFEPTAVRCPHCAQTVTTQTTTPDDDYQTGTCTWIAVALLCLCVDPRNL